MQRLAHSKKLEADVANVRNVNSKLVERIVATERQCIASVLCAILDEGYAGGDWNSNVC